MPRIKVEEVKTKKAKTTAKKTRDISKIVKNKKGKAEKDKTIAKKTSKKLIKNKILDDLNINTEVKNEKPKVIKTKKATAKKTTAKNVITKKVSTKKVTTSKQINNKKTIAKKTITKKTATKKVVPKKEKKYLSEYYDLPYRYNDTIVRILYQTPKRIFVYWDISDSDRQRYINAFGEDFFEKTYPVLLVHNEDMNYTFEVKIDDFANSWYIDINDSKNKYIVQLGRKFKEIQANQIDYKIVEEEKINLQNDYIYITHSNKLETPNDKVLFANVPKKISFKNVKTGEITYKETKQVLEVLKKVSKIYDNPKIEDLYRELYGEEILLEEASIIGNPSSGNSSSFFK